MSLKHCSLALEAEESRFNLQVEAPLTLVVDKSYVSVTGVPSVAHMALNDVIELGGTITVSF